MPNPMHRTVTSGRAGGGGSGRSWLQVQYFFDKPAVLTALDRAAQRVLSRFGAYVRQTARQLIRRPRRLHPEEMSKEQRRRWHQRGEPVEFAPSRPGEPPRNRTGLLRDNIFFWYDLRERKVVIGPPPFPGSSGDTPGVIEHGGTIVAGRGRGRHMEARPFMGPALRRELPGLEAMWRDSVRRI